MTETHRVLTLTATVLTGLSAGAFLAFSTFVAPALDRLPARQSIAAMQSINRLAPNPLFLLAIFGPVLLAGALVIAGVRSPARVGVALVAATGCALAGALITVVYHVPHNDTLASVQADSPDADAAWRDFYGGWLALNHVRAAAYTAATALFAVSLGAAHD